MNTIALIFAQGHEYAARLTEGAMIYLQKHPGPHIFELPYTEGDCPPEIGEAKIDGAILWADHASDWVHALNERDIKLVNCNGEWVAEGIPSVGFSLSSLVNEITQHFQKIGNQRIAILSQTVSGSVMRSRLVDWLIDKSQQLGFEGTAHEVPGIPSSEPVRLLHPELEHKLISILQDTPKPVSIFCDDDYLGIIVCQVAKHLGFDVPGDVAVLGVLDTIAGKLATPALSSIPQPGRLVGYEAMKLMMQCLKGQQPLTGRVPVECPSTIARESTIGRPHQGNEIQRLLSLINETACEGLTVNELLESSTISQKTLNKRFIEAIGRTPGEEIRRVKCERAKHWLETTDLSISRIANISGFSEASKFNIFFKREAGCTPTQYRRTSRA